MRIQLGCRLSYRLLPVPTPMILLLNVHYSRASDLERPDLLVTDLAVPVESYRDGFGNWCNRLVAPTGAFAVSTAGIVREPACRTRSTPRPSSTPSSGCPLTR
ncbi:MAG: hypothetical protein ACFBWO_14135 [Paracoccaceae bacterium]